MFRIRIGFNADPDPAFYHNSSFLPLPQLQSVLRIRDQGSDAFLNFDPWIRDPRWVKSQDPDPE
jgi:hypothetical protein